MAGKKPWIRCKHDSDGMLWLTQNLAKFARDHDLDGSTCRKVLKKQYGANSAKGWRFVYNEGPVNDPIWEAKDRVGALSVPEKEVPIADYFPDGVGGDKEEVDYSSVEGLSDSSGDSPIERYRLLADMIMKAAMDCAKGEGDKGARLRELTGVLDSFGKAYNIDPKTAKDTRSVGEQVVDGISDLLRDPNAIWEKPDIVILGIEHEMLNVVNMSGEMYDRFHNAGVRAIDLMSKADLLRLDPMQDAEAPPSPK